MKTRLIDVFKLRFLRETKWNELYENDTHIFIFNTTTKECKIKPKM